MGISSKLLLDATGTPGSELDSIYSLNDRGRSKERNGKRGTALVRGRLSLPVTRNTGGTISSSSFFLFFSLDLAAPGYEMNFNI